MTFHLDPPVTPSPTHAWRHSGDSAGSSTIQGPCNFPYVLRIYEFTDLPPSLPLSSGTPQTRNSESSYRRQAGRGRARGDAADVCLAAQRTHGGEPPGARPHGKWCLRNAQNHRQRTPPPPAPPGRTHTRHTDSTYIHTASAPTHCTTPLQRPGPSRPIDRPIRLFSRSVSVPPPHSFAVHKRTLPANRDVVGEREKSGGRGRLEAPSRCPSGRCDPPVGCGLADPVAASGATHSRCRCESCLATRTPATRMHVPAQPQPRTQSRRACRPPQSQRGTRTSPPTHRCSLRARHVMCPPRHHRIVRL